MKFHILRSLKKFEHKIIGEGHNGKCYKITMNDKHYTCKKIKITKNNRFNREIKILKNLNTTENLPEYFNSFSNINHHYILYNFIEGEDLEYTLYPYRVTDNGNGTLRITNR